MNVLVVVWVWEGKDWGEILKRGEFEVFVVWRLAKLGEGGKRERARTRFESPRVALTQPEPRRACHFCRISEYLYLSRVFVLVI